VLLTLLLLAVLMVVLVQWRAGVREAQAEAAYPASGQFVAVEGTRIHLKVEGTGPDLVLIHGASGSLRDFTFDLVGRLKDRYRVIALDRPGLGRSGRPEGYGGAWNNAAEPPALQARLLEAAAQQIGIEKPIVLGHSYGGAVALAWALEHPDETAGLVLLAAASTPWPGSLGLLYNVNASRPGGALVVPLITAFAPRSAIENTVVSIFIPQEVPEGYIAHFGPELTLRRATMRANAQQVNSLRPYVVEMKERYSGLKLPVEILHGTEDTIVPLAIHSEPLSRQIPGARLTRMEGIGHAPHHADAEAVVAAIDRVAARAGLR
jgi:pimeloyl-ACP methyl ester carboxylesterase